MPYIPLTGVTTPVFESTVAIFVLNDVIFTSLVDKVSVSGKRLKLCFAVIFDLSITKVSSSAIVILLIILFGLSNSSITVVPCIILP